MTAVLDCAVYCINQQKARCKTHKVKQNIRKLIAAGRKRLNRLVNRSAKKAGGQRKDDCFFAVSATLPRQGAHFNSEQAKLRKVCQFSDKVIRDISLADYCLKQRAHHFQYRFTLRSGIRNRLERTAPDKRERQEDKDNIYNNSNLSIRAFS